MKQLSTYRKFLTTAVMLAILACTTTPALAEQHAARSASKLGFQSIVGSWKLVDDVTDDVFFGTYNGGLFRGTVNFSSADSSVSLTHGAWERTGPRTFADTDSALINSETGVLIITFRAEIELSADGDTGTFDYEFEVALLDGTVVDFVASTATGTRIKVEPLSTR